jgi:hypothetical protein
MRTAEWLRQQLQEVAEGLGARDLEKVMAFAEFVRARRVARGFIARGEGEEPASERAGSGPTEQQPPSSRKLSAAR